MRPRPITAAEYATFKSIVKDQLAPRIAEATTTRTLTRDDANAVYVALRGSDRHVRTFNYARDGKDKCFSALVVGDLTEICVAVAQEDGSHAVTVGSTLLIPGTTLAVSRIKALCASHTPILDAVTRFTYVVHARQD